MHIHQRETEADWLHLRLLHNEELSTFIDLQCRESASKVHRRSASEEIYWFCKEMRHNVTTLILC